MTQPNQHTYKTKIGRPNHTTDPKIRTNIAEWFKTTKIYSYKDRRSKYTKIKNICKKQNKNGLESDVNKTAFS